jgi:hypothetical protein
LGKLRRIINYALFYTKRFSRSRWVQISLKALLFFIIIVGRHVEPAWVKVSASIFPSVIAKSKH